MALAGDILASTPIVGYVDLAAYLDTQSRTYSDFEAYLDSIGATYSDWDGGSITITEEDLAAYFAANP